MSFRVELPIEFLLQIIFYNMITWELAIRHALRALGGHAYLKDIYQMINDLGERECREPSVRRTLEQYSSDSEAYVKTNPDYFYSVDGIGSGHWGLRDFIYSKNSIDLTQNDADFSEGKPKLVQHIVRERNQVLVNRAKYFFKQKHGRFFCEICGFDFEKMYGNLGKDFIEAHHVRPVSELKDGDTTKIEDIVMLCSNCHSMVHKKKPWLKKEDFASIIRSR